MKKLKLILILLILLVCNQFKAQSKIVVQTKLGSYNVTYVGKMTWYEAENKGKQIGYRLPTYDEFMALISSWAMKNEVYAEAKSAGFVNEGQYIWTSKDEGSSWSCNKECAFVMWYDRMEKDKTLDKDDFRLATFLVKKVK